MSEQMIKPYGDTFDDGQVQLSFTLPVEIGARATKAAIKYTESLNFKDVAVVHSSKLADNFTCFVVYAKGIPSLNYKNIEATEVESTQMDYYEINSLIKTKLNRQMVVVGATIGSDAHTVGIDAIMNMKGYNGDYGLERYPEIQAFNLGSQVTAEKLLAKSLEVKADAILVSQTVTQKDSHIRNFTEFVELLEAENIRDKFLLVAGGPRINNDLAIELGYNAGFGAGTTPNQVAAFIICKLLNI
ncbi:MAG: cobalamin-dependent protein [Bacteriovoracaceae bacterium]|nr:cobalamin-dependent protein [Bacteriovoracaceae bacterium]